MPYGLDAARGWIGTSTLTYGDINTIGMDTSFPAKTEKYNCTQ